jgi:hypothetical protein
MVKPFLESKKSSHKEMSSSIFLSQALPTGYKLEETLELHIKL